MKKIVGIHATRRQFLAAAVAAGVASGEDAVAFKPATKAALESILAGERYRGRIAAGDVAALVEREGVRRDALMVKLVAVARRFAHPPISKYFVGAVSLGTSGSLYLGQNIEFPGGTLGMAVHAEQSSVANAYMSEESGIEAIAIGGAPCGHCRQFLSEVSLEENMRVLMGNGPEARLKEILPRVFGPKNLGHVEGSFPVRRVGLALSGGAAAARDALVKVALQAAEGAYAPYSGARSGVAVETLSGRVFAGSYIENAAFNPSLPPLQAALAGYFAAGGSEGAGRIRRVVLVEGEKGTVRHGGSAQLALETVAPGVKVELVGLLVG